VKDALQLAALVATRICHDLAGPVGGVSNGIELLHEVEGDLQTQSMELIDMSAKESISRLTFLRRAFGTVSAKLMLKFDVIEQCCHDYYAQKNVLLTFENSSGEDTIASDQVKALFNALLTVTDIMIYGGKVSIHYGTASNQHYFKMTGETKGDSLSEKQDKNVLAILKGEAADVPDDPKYLPSYLLYVVAKELKKKIVVDVQDKTVEIMVG